ncbi:cytochrome c oxidase subunit II [Paucibacter sp. M5-1]|uniref:cytochrome c oxidase subunit II n=1 Tax=Paucibacter sp. M5-1 TaxID=3015998 RepID=UPI0010F5E048|nr:cytochrome c oxidase subunit II [Paucibacter sp. M5-1]MCZ7879947.1 cytochrome c oxidase subunit II [Paucibacter sp. M5-1]
MLIAITLAVIVLASLLFHYINPWHPPALASNWKQMDDTLTITFVITGIFFVILNLFLVYVIWRFRRRGSKATETVAYQPVNHKLERWLTVITTVGIVALLAPGLKVYADYVTPPKDALEVEVLGSQWQWRYRFPGADGQLGATDARFVTASNPFGLDPDDAKGQDDALVDASELHLPLNQPVKILLRAHDVLHDFYVPPFRARMNMVPGLVTTFWFTPTQAGRFEAMCAQLCGVGHAAMRGLVVVEEAPAFQAWLAGKPSFAAASKPAPVATADGGSSDPLAMGLAVAKAKACVACHSADGSAGVGPSWKGLYGKTEAFADGSKEKIDDAVLAREIREPAAKVVQGFAPIMPKSELSEAEVTALVAYIRSLDPVKN